MSHNSGNDLYMLHMRHIRNDKYQDSFIELHPDRALNSLNGVVRKNAQNKFLLTMTGYKYSINHVDNNQYVLLEIIKGIRYYGWRLLSSHAHSYNSNSMDLIVETNFFFEIDSMEFILQNSTSTENSSDRYSMYESKKTDQLLADVEQMRRAEQQALSIDFDYEEVTVSGTNPTAKLRKLPNVAEYGQVLLDSNNNKAVMQSGPYGFARQHGHSPKNRKEEEAIAARRASEAARVASPPAAAPARKLSGVTFAEANIVIEHDSRHEPSPTVSETPPVEVKTNGTHPPAQVEVPKAEVPKAEATKPLSRIPSLNAVFAPRASATNINVAPVVATPAPAPIAVTTIEVTQPAVVLPTPAVTAPVVQASSVQAPVPIPVVKASPSPSIVQSAPAKAPSPITALPPPVTATTTAEPSRRPSLTSGLTAEEKQTAADKLFQKYGMKKASFTGSATRGSFTSTEPVILPPPIVLPTSSASRSESTSATNSGSAQPKTSAEVTDAANRLFEKYNRNPPGTETTPPPISAPVSVLAPSTPPSAKALSVSTNGSSSNLLGTLPLTSPHFSMVSLFGQPESEALSVVKSELVHHPTVVVASDGTEVRSIGGFRRVKSVIITEDHDDYGDISKLKGLEEDSTHSAATNISTKPPSYNESKLNVKSTVDQPVVPPVPTAAPAVVPTLPPVVPVKQSPIVAEKQPEKLPEKLSTVPSETSVNAARPPLGQAVKPSLQRVNTDMNVDPVSSGLLKTNSEDDYGENIQLKPFGSKDHEEVHLAQVRSSKNLTPAQAPTSTVVPSATTKTVTPAIVVPPVVVPSVVPATPEPKPLSARNSVSFVTPATPATPNTPASMVTNLNTPASAVSSMTPMSTPASNMSTPFATPITPGGRPVVAAVAVDEHEDSEEEGGKLRRPSSMFVAPNPMDLLARKPVFDNSTLEEKQAAQTHESSRTNHYSKLGSAFVSENVLASGRGGGRGRGRGIR